MSRAQTDAHAASAIAMIQMGRDSQDPLRRARILSDSQMELGWTLRAAITECRDKGHSWATIGDALGVPKETLFRQYAGGGPIVTAKAVQRLDSPVATDLHQPRTEAIYAFRSQTGVWQGPKDALPPGKFTDGTLQFAPAEPVTPFAGQHLTMRFGLWSEDVTVHACQVSLLGGQPRRVRITQEVLDYLFGNAQTPLRQALTALVYATVGNPRVAHRLQDLINHAASAMTLETPTAQFIASVEAVISEAQLVDTGDPHVIVAFRRLQRVVLEFQAWAAVNATRP